METYTHVPPATFGNDKPSPHKLKTVGLAIPSEHKTGVRCNANFLAQRGPSAVAERTT